MSIVYKEFIENFNTNKPDWFQSSELKIVFVRPGYVPNKEHKFKDIEQFIYPFGSIKITSARIERDEIHTMYYIDDLKAIKTHGGQYMLFFDDSTKGLIFIKDIGIVHNTVSFNFKSALFAIDRSGNINFNLPSIGMNFKTGKHKLVIE